MSKTASKLKVAGHKGAVLAVALGALMVSGCAVRSGLETPEPEAPAQWENQIADSRAAVSNPAWWQGFGSDELNQLVARSLSDNTDLRAAAARVLQAEGRLQQAGSSLFPSLSLDGGASTSGTFGGTSSDSFQLRANTSYELDLWGRLRNNKAIARETRYALAVLVGDTPQGFLLSDGGLDELTVPEIEPGLPAEVLAQRPDVGRALANLMAADYGVAVARSAYWPSLSLTGGAGYASSSLSDLFDGDAVYSLAASLSQLLFDGGQVRGENTTARAAWLEQVATYRGVLLTALSEVDQSLGSINALEQQDQFFREALAQARRSFEIAEVRYREGDIELTSVLDAQTSLNNARRNMLDQRYNELLARVTLYRVLGQGLAGFPEAP